MLSWGESPTHSLVLDLQSSEFLIGSTKLCFEVFEFVLLVLDFSVPGGLLVQWRTEGRPSYFSSTVSASSPIVPSLKRSSNAAEKFRAIVLVFWVSPLAHHAGDVNTYDIGRPLGLHSEPESVMILRLNLMCKCLLII